MGIPNKQIGWSQESNLLWQISNQLDQLIKVTASLTTSTTTTTTTTTPSSFSVIYYMSSYGMNPCSGVPISGNPQYASTNDPFAITQLFSDAALTTPTIMSSGTGYYTFTYDSGATLYSAAFGDTGGILSGVTAC